MKEKKTVWKDYFRMLRDAGLPYKLMAVCFLLAAVL